MVKVLRRMTTQPKNGVVMGGVGDGVEGLESHKIEQGLHQPHRRRIGPWCGLQYRAWMGRTGYKLDIVPERLYAIKLTRKRLGCKEDRRILQYDRRR